MINRGLNLKFGYANLVFTVRSGLMGVEPAYIAANRILPLLCFTHAVAEYAICCVAGFSC